LFPRIFRGPGSLILERHPDCLEEMDQKHDQQSDLDGHDKRITDERVCVGVEGFRAENDEKVAGDVQNQVQEEQDSRNADNQFRGDQRTKETPTSRHQLNSIRNCLTQTNSERYDSMFRAYENPRVSSQTNSCEVRRAGAFGRSGVQRV
jgi:hypothetical protein